MNGTLYWSSIGVGGSTELVISPLKAGTVYQVKVGAANAVGSGAYSSEIKVSTQVGIPSGPEALTAVAGPTMVQLNWSAPTNNVGGPVESYVVQQLQGTAYVTVATPVTSTALVTGLTTGVTYTFRVFSQNASGMSGTGALVTVKTNTTNIPAPQNVQITSPTATGATITWDSVVSPSALSVTSYLVTATPATGPSVTFTATTNSLVLTGLAPVSTYSVTVAALIGQVIGVPSAALTLSTANNVPGAPQNLRGIFGTTATYLSWNTPLTTGGSPITGYVVQKLVAGNWVDTYTQISRMQQVPNLAVGQTDTYRVIAKNANGLGAPTAPLALSGRAAVAGAPIELQSSAIDANGKVTLSWKAPLSDGGAAVTSYQVYLKKNTSLIWEPISSPEKTSLTTFAPMKGSSWSYRVAARNSSGIGATSNEVLVDSPKGAPSAPTASVSLTGTDEITLRWNPPVDNGGEPVTGYRIEKTIDNVWSEAATVPADSRSWVEKRGGPGQRTGYRVSAVNSLGASPASATVSVQVPYEKADAPIGVTAVLDASLTKVTLSWSAPEKTGGSPISSYYVEMSRDGGTNWAQVGQTNSSGRSVAVAAVAKGTSAKYRVVAYTLATFGAYSEAVSVDVPSTAPAAPRSAGGTFSSNGDLLVSWASPLDNGGSPITGYLVERLTDGSWKTLDTVKVTNLTIQKEAPGSLVELRITAQNVVGSSTALQMRVNFPFVKSEAVSDLAVSISGVKLTLTWAAPKYTGGTPVTLYVVERSVNNGLSWTIASYVRSGTTFTNVIPAKGTSVKYRVLPETAFGRGLARETELISTELTAPNAPAISGRGFAVDGSYNISWRQPSDNGGTAITGYLVERLVSGSWTKLAELPATTLNLNMARDLPGTAVSIRVSAVNSVGASVLPTVLSYQIPALRASAPQNVAVTAASSGQVNVSWQAPASLGGSSLSGYQVQFSRDGGLTWLSIYPSANAVSVRTSGPSKGQTWLYRVAAFTSGAGVSELSTVVSYQNPLTVSSSVTSLSAYRTSSAVTLMFRAPQDLGGYTTISYLVQRFSNGVWINESPTLQLDGTTMTRRLALPAKGLTTYRVIAVNGSGESAPAQVQVAY